MKLSSRGDYATRVVMELAAAEGPHALSVHELASRTGISQKYLEQIMSRAFDEVWDATEGYRTDMRLGAYAVGVSRVAEATRIRGIYPWLYGGGMGVWG